MHRSLLITALITALIALASSPSCKKDSAPTPPPGPGTGVAMPDPFDVKNAPVDAVLDAAPDAPPVPPPPAPIPTTIPCDQLARAECLRSDHCTLELVAPNLYSCRADQGPCEIGIVQSNQTACTTKAGCAWKNAECYCRCVGAARTVTVDEPSTGCACGCGGGPPETCFEVKK